MLTVQEQVSNNYKVFAEEYHDEEARMLMKVALIGKVLGAFNTNASALIAQPLNDTQKLGSALFMQYCVDLMKAYCKAVEVEDEGRLDRVVSGVNKVNYPELAFLSNFNISFPIMEELQEFVAFTKEFSQM